MRQRRRQISKHNARLQIVAAAESSAESKRDLPGAEPEPKIEAEQPEPAVDREATRGASAPVQGNFIPVLRPEDLPKGARKEVRAQDTEVLLFWYRNDVFAIEARSPAEGAYSEGFINSKFTQDYGIECPSTKSVFSLKTGDVETWYPNNAVLRLLTPQSTCRRLDIFPVKVTQDAIYVDVTSSSRARITRGGADSSVGRDNVYAIEPRSYIQGQNPADPYSAPDIDIGKDDAGTAAKVATIVVTGLGFSATAIIGTAYGLYRENYLGLGIFWLCLFGFSALAVVQYQNGVKRQQNQR